MVYIVERNLFWVTKDQNSNLLLTKTVIMLSKFKKCNTISQEP